MNVYVRLNNNWIQYSSFLFLFCAVFAVATPSGFAWTVDEASQTITLDENESVNYSEFSSNYSSYAIHLAEGSSVTHTEWIFNPLTGTGSFILASTVESYDNPQKAMGNLSNFSGTVVLKSENKLRLRGSSYSSFSENATIDISGGAQLWLNENLKSSIYLHDMGGAYDGIGQVRFDTDGATISGDIAFSGDSRIASRKDHATTVNYITGSITGVHAEGDDVKDNMVFNGAPSYVNTYPTIVLTARNSWNGTTEIKHICIELQENATLGSGKITLSSTASVTNSDSSTWVSDPGHLVINKSSDFTIANDVVSNGGALTNKGAGTTVFSGSLKSFAGTINANAGTIQIAADSGNRAGGIVLKGTGRVCLDGDFTASFNFARYDFSDFEGTLEILQGRTMETNPDYFGENATLKINPGASLMFYTGEGTNIKGDFKSNILISGLGHSENRGAIRFHDSLSAEELAKLNTAQNVGLSNITGNVELFGDSFFNSRAGDKIAWGAISGNISGEYDLMLNDNVGHGWILLTGTNSWQDTLINGGTVQLGYVGSINGTEYDGTTGTLGTGLLTVKSGATLDYRRVNAMTYAGEIVNEGTILVNSGEFIVSGALKNSGLIHVAKDAVFTRTNQGTLAGKFTGDGTITYSYFGEPSNTISADFSEFNGTILLDATPGRTNRVMLSYTTVDFGENSTVRINDQGQLYLAGATVYANLELGTSTGYAADGSYAAGLRSDGGASYLYGTLKLLDDGAQVSNRCSNNSSELILYADVTGPGSLLKHEDSASQAGLLAFGTTEKNGKTYGGTVAYEGTTTVESGVLRVMDGVTMFVQDNVKLGNGDLKGTFELEEGATLSIGADSAVTGTTVSITGDGTLSLAGSLEFDVFSENDFDQLIIDSALLDLAVAPDAVNIMVAEDVVLTDEPIQLTEGFSTSFWENVDLFVSKGFDALILADGNLGVRTAAPEPASWLLMLSGLAFLFLRRNWGRKNA